MSKGKPRSGRGIITVGTGTRYRGEIQTLIKSIKENSPTFELTVFTDEAFLGNSDSKVKELLVDSPTFSFYDKISAIAARPYEQTLYVDVDTWISRDITGIFELLKACDFAAMQDTWRVSYAGSPPEIFPEPNCGVLLMGDSVAVDELISKWNANYRSLEKSWTGEGGSFGDQHPLWEAIWQMQCEKTLRFLSLPNEWNFHIWHPNSLAQNALPGIIHGRGKNLAKISRDLASSSLAKSWIPNSIGWNGKKVEDGILFGSRSGNLAVLILGQTARLIARLKRIVRLKGRIH